MVFYFILDILPETYFLKFTKNFLFIEIDWGNHLIESLVLLLWLLTTWFVFFQLILNHIDTHDK